MGSTETHICGLLSSCQIVDSPINIYILNQQIILGRANGELTGET